MTKIFRLLLILTVRFYQKFLSPLCPGVSLENHHNALADAQACAGIVMDLARRSAAGSMEELAAHYGTKILSANL